MISEYNKKKKLYDTWFSLDNYINEYQVNGYKIYEYEDCYELIFINEKEVFYLSATKNKRTPYDYEDLLKNSEELRAILQEWEYIQNT